MAAQHAAVTARKTARPAALPPGPGAPAGLSAQKQARRAAGPGGQGAGRCSCDDPAALGPDRAGVPDGAGAALLAGAGRQHGVITNCNDIKYFSLNATAYTLVSF